MALRNRRTSNHFSAPALVRADCLYRSALRVTVGVSVRVGRFNVWLATIGDIAADCLQMLALMIQTRCELQLTLSVVNCTALATSLPVTARLHRESSVGPRYLDDAPSSYDRHRSVGLRSFV